MAHIDLLGNNISNNPQSGYYRIYFKSDGLPYYRDSAGTETVFSTGGIPDLGTSKQIDSTGIKQGASLAVNGTLNTKWDLGAGEAYVMDYSDPANITSKLVTWTAQSSLNVANLLTAPRTNVAISLTNAADSGVSFTNSFPGTIDGVAGTIYIAEKSSDNFTSEQLRKYAQVGRLVHDNNTDIRFVVPLQRHTESPLTTALTFIDLFPAQNVSGNEFTPSSGVNLSVDKSAGQGFRVGSNYQANLLNPDIQDIPAATPTSHRYRYRDGSGGWVDGSFLTALDPTIWDNGSGSLQSVTNNRWTVQPVYVFAGSGSMFILPGQQVFTAKSAAVEAIATLNPVIDDNLTNDAVFRGWFVVRSGGTDTNDSNDYEWRPPVGEIGGGTGTPVVVDLQTAYDNSADPEILTDSTRGALTIKRGSAADTDCVVEVQNGAGTQTFCVDGEGDIIANSAVLNGINAIQNLSSVLTQGNSTGANKFVFQNYTNATPVSGELWYEGSEFQLKGPSKLDGNVTIDSNNNLYLSQSKLHINSNVTSDKLYFNDFAGTTTYGAISRFVSSGTGLRLESNGVLEMNSTNFDLNTNGDVDMTGVLNLASTTNSTPGNGDVWNNGTEVETQGNTRITDGNVSIEKVVGLGGSFNKAIRLGASDSASVNSGNVYKWDFRVGGDANGQLLSIRKWVNGGGQVSLLDFNNTTLQANAILDVGTDETSPQLRIGKNTFATTNAQSGISNLVSGGSIFNDYKTNSGGTIFFRCGEGAEAGSTHQFMVVDPTDGNITLPNNLQVDGLTELGNVGQVNQMYVGQNVTNGSTQNVSRFYYNTTQQGFFNARGDNDTFEIGGRVSAIVIDSATGDVTLPNNLQVDGATINMANLPTSATGLSAGDLWNDSGTLKIA